MSMFFRFMKTNNPKVNIMNCRYSNWTTMCIQGLYSLLVAPKITMDDEEIFAIKMKLRKEAFNNCVHKIN